MKIGDKVIYKMQTLPDVGLIHDQVYTVQDTAECGGCKDNLHIDVGILNDHSFVYCNICRTIINIDDRYFFHHSGFEVVWTVEEEVSLSSILHDIFDK